MDNQKKLNNPLKSAYKKGFPVFMGVRQSLPGFSTLKGILFIGGNMRTISKAVLFLLVLVLGCGLSHAEMLSPHFSRAEFNQHQNPLPVRSLPVDPRLVQKLEELRVIVMNRPIIISSGYRSPFYNTIVGGVSHSQHILGKAADIEVKGVDNRMLGNYARIVGFSFVKVYKNHVHVDVR